ncbi:MAG: hypothetical protein KUG82_05275 [Pseudomonadales bacterium]|nr:hypothetical protein [Pseudomonadales bacterium]
MKTNKFLLPLTSVLVACMSLIACGGGGGGGGGEAPPADLTDPPVITDPVTTEGRITGLWGGTVAISGLFSMRFLYLVTDQGSTATVYDCFNHSSEVFDVTGNQYRSRNLDEEDNSVLRFTYKDESKIGVRVGPNEPYASYINLLNGSLRKTEDNRFSLNSDGDAPSLEEVTAVCGDAIEEGGAANLGIAAAYGDDVLELEMSFRGGADRDNANVLGSNVKATMKSSAFQVPLVTNEVVFTSGFITFDTCSEDEAAGSYSLESDTHGVFSGNFLVSEPGLDVCAEIDLNFTGIVDEDPATELDDCSDVDGVSGLTGVWTMDGFQKTLLRGALLTIDEVSENNLDPTGLIDAGLLIMDEAASLGMAICEMEGGALEVEKDEENGTLSQQLNELFVDDSLIGSVDIQSTSTIKVDINVLGDNFPSITFRKRSRESNNVCMNFVGTDKLARASVACIDKPIIALDGDEVNTKLNMAMIIDGSIYRVEMDLNRSIQAGTYTLGEPDGGSVVIISEALKETYTNGVVFFQSGTITIMEKGRNHVKGKLELTSTGGQDVNMDFYSKIY